METFTFDTQLNEMMATLAPSGSLVEKGVTSVAPASIISEHKKTRRTNNNKKFRGRSLICTTDIYEEWVPCATNFKYETPTKPVKGVVNVPNRDVHAHAANDAYEVNGDWGTVLVFIAKEHGFQNLVGETVTLLDFHKYSKYNGCTIKWKEVNK